MNLVRQSDGQKLIGQLTGCQGGKAGIAFPSAPELMPGDIVHCGIGDGKSFCRMCASVTQVNGSQTEIWVSLESVVMGIDRATRYRAENISLLLGEQPDQREVELLDASKTGFRVRSSTRFPIAVMQRAQIEIDGTELSMTAKCVRVHQEWQAELCDSAFAISEIDRLSKARWISFVTGLSRAYGRAA